MSIDTALHPPRTGAPWSAGAVALSLRGRIDARLQAAAPGDEPASRAVRDLLGAGGKRLRPVLVHLGGALVGADAALLDELAEAAELVHVASLLHDDLVDGSASRRGRPAAWVALGPKAAVLGGDRAHVLALQRVVRAPGRVLPRFIETVAAMVEAQSVEIDQVGQLAGGEAAWRRVAWGKTAALCGWCAEVGALAVGDDLAAAALRGFGEALGLAFQAVDDLVDLVPGMDPGKPAFADLRARVPSLPLRLAACQEPEVGQAVERFWRAAGEPPTDLVEAVRRAGVEPAAAFTSRALRDALDSLSSLPTLDGCAVLAAMAGDLAARAEVCRLAAALPLEVP
jgi:octaprenyl-diphosphate synthase